MKTKLCSICKKYKHTTKFYKHPYTKDRLSHRCIKCKNEARTILSEMCSNAKLRAKRKGIEFSITQEDIQTINKRQNSKCIYSGMTLNWDHSSKGSKKGVPPKNRASLDRINPNKGYTKNNIQLVINPVNKMKHDLSHIELIKYCQLIINNIKNASH